MQIVLGVFVMRTEFGIYFFKFLGKQIDKFLSFTDYGSRLVFGVKHTDHFFAFKVNKDRLNLNYKNDVYRSSRRRCQYSYSLAQ